MLFVYRQPKAAVEMESADTRAAVDFDERLFGGRRVVMLDSCGDGVLCGTRFRKAREYLFFARKPQDAQEHGDREAAFAVYLHVNALIGVRFDLYPHAARRNYLRAEVIGALVGSRFT